MASPLTGIGIARAFKDLAFATQGVKEGDQVIDWCVRHGYLVHGPAREQVQLTEAGAAIVFVYWKAVAESIRVRSGDLALGDATILSKTRGEHQRIHLPDGTSIDLAPDTIAAAAEAGTDQALHDASDLGLQADEAADQADAFADQHHRPSGDTTAVVSSDPVGDNSTVKGG